MKIESEFDLIEALRARTDARKLSGLLQECEILAGRLEYHDLERPELEDAVVATNRALDEIEESLDRFEGKAA